jgi:hypothetical protein
VASIFEVSELYPPLQESSALILLNAIYKGKSYVFTILSAPIPAFAAVRQTLENFCLRRQCASPAKVHDIDEDASITLSSKPLFLLKSAGVLSGLGT